MPVLPQKVIPRTRDWLIPALFVAAVIGFAIWGFIDLSIKLVSLVFG